MESIQGLFEILLLVIVALKVLLPAAPLLLLPGGIRMFKVIRKLYRKHRLSKANIAQVDEMDGKEFEDYLAALFKNLGYRVRETPCQGDFGGDLVIRKDGNRCVVQAKRYSRSVGVQAVQQVVAAKEYYKCNSAMVVTNSDYTKQAIKLAKANKVELWDRHKLVNAILSVRGKVSPSQELSHVDMQTIEHSYVHAEQNRFDQPTEHSHGQTMQDPYPQSIPRHHPQPVPFAHPELQRMSNRMFRENATWRGADNVNAKNVNAKAVRRHTAHRSCPQRSCQICGNPVSQRIVDYCRSHTSALRGEVYCFEHLNELQARPKAAQPVSAQPASARQASSSSMPASLNQSL